MKKLLHPERSFRSAVESILKKIEQTIPIKFKEQIDIVLVGGVAVHFYTQYRVSRDLEFISNQRIMLPSDVKALYQCNGVQNELSLDTNFFSSIALLHPDAIEDAIFYKKLGKFSIKVLSPTDLVVSKIGRLEGNDLQDIRELAKLRLLNTDKMKERTEEALQYYIGDTALKMYNLRDALDAIEEINEVLLKGDEPSNGTCKP